MIVSPDKSGRTDAVLYDILKNVNSQLPIVPITRLENFVFNEELNNLKDYILVDMSEEGWNWDMSRTTLFGYDLSYIYFFKSYQWDAFNQFVANNPPKLYFKRELLSKDATDTIVPIQYPALFEPPAIQSKEDFNKRIFQVFFGWGFSHNQRKILHGEIWQQSCKDDYVVCDNLYQLNALMANETNPKKWVSVHLPHYARLPMEEINKINGMAKISVSLGGAGRVCFRHTEASLNSAMLMWHDDIKWSYDWVDNVNCIKCEQGKEIERVMSALNDSRLYDIYVAGVDTCRKYWLPNYVKHIEKLIKEKC